MALDRNLRFMALPDFTATLSSDSTNTTGGAGHGFPINPAAFLSFAGWAGNNCAVNRGVIVLSKATKQTVDATLTLTQVTVSGTNAIYTTNTSLIGKNYTGWAIQFSGFTNFGNNGTFIVTSNTTSGTNDTLTVTLISQVNETHAGSATFLTNITNYTVSPAGSYGAGVNNAQAQAKFYVSDFPTNAGNNTPVGRAAGFVCVASDVTTIAVTNASGVNETNPATAWPVMSNPSSGNTNSSTTFGLTKAVVQSAFSRTITNVTFAASQVTLTMASDASAANAYQNWVIHVTGLNTAANNGFFMCASSTSTTLVLANTAGAAEAPPGGALAISLATYVNYLGQGGGDGGTTGGGAGAGTLNPSGAYTDSVVTITNFVNSGNNGQFKVLSSSAASFGVVNASGVNETPASNRQGIATINSGVSWAFNQTGFVNTNDGGQIVWNTVSFLGQITNADGTIGGNVVRYTLSVTPSGIRIGQMFTVTGTTSGTFDLSGQITAINSGAKTVDVTMGTTPSNTSQSGLTANGWVLAGTLIPGQCPNNNAILYVAPGTAGNQAFPTTFRGQWSALNTYQSVSQGIQKNLKIYGSYAFNDVVWNSPADPNYYVCVSRATWSIISATGNGTTITYTTGSQGIPGTAPFAQTNTIVANEFVTVTGCTTPALNVVNAKVTSVATNTFTVTVGGFSTTEGEGVNAQVNVVPGVTGNATSDSATLNHWVPYNYEIFKSNDGNTAYYTKVEYLQGQSNAATLLVTFATGTDGNGGLTQPPSYRFPLGNSSGTGATTVLTESCFWGVGSGANLVFIHPRTGSFGSGISGEVIAIERSKNNSGTDTSDYITAVFGYGSMGNAMDWAQTSFILASLPYKNIANRHTNQFTFFKGTNDSIAAGGVFSIGISSSQGSWRAGQQGSANVAIAPIFPNVGFLDNPLTLIQGLSKIVNTTYDVVDNTIITCTMYGATRTYLVTDMPVGGGTHNFPAVTSTNQGVIAIRWEA